MGATASNAQSRTAKSPKEKAAPYGEGNSAVPTGKITWYMVPTDLVVDTIGYVNAVGDGISFSSARNQTWIGVTVLADDSRPNWKWNTVEEAILGLSYICDAAQKRRTDQP